MLFVELPNEIIYKILKFMDYSDINEFRKIDNIHIKKYIEYFDIINLNNLDGDYKDIYNTLMENKHNNIKQCIFCIIHDENSETCIENHNDDVITICKCMINKCISCKCTYCYCEIFPKCHICDYKSLCRECWRKTIEPKQKYSNKFNIEYVNILCCDCRHYDICYKCIINRRKDHNYTVSYGCICYICKKFYFII